MDWVELKKCIDVNSVDIPLCCCLESADSRFISVIMILWIRAGEQGRSGLQDKAAGITWEGHGEGHGEGCGDGWGDGIGDAALEEEADFVKTDDFSHELDLEESLTAASDFTDLEESRWLRKPGHVWCPELGRLYWPACWWTCWVKCGLVYCSESERWRLLWQVWWSALRDVWSFVAAQVCWADVEEGCWQVGRDLSELWRHSWTSRVGAGRGTLELGCSRRAEGFWLSSFSLLRMFCAWKGAALKVGEEDLWSSCQWKRQLYQKLKWGVPFPFGTNGWNEHFFFLESEKF